jgi:hypothetical protein
VAKILFCRSNGDINYNCLTIGVFTDGKITEGGEWDWDSFIQNRKESGMFGKVAPGAYSESELEWLTNKFGVRQLI